ncbi:hypothetical protein DV736_g392, partial [Chaetothyriales sp. CBS 134916]
MPVDYSKWDALELSDDSDIEVHPNVDKRSFIRAKQNQIHQQRFERRREIETLKYERVINDGLLERINGLLDALEKHRAQADHKNPDELVFQALIESAGDPAKDEPPKPPPGVYSDQKEPQPRYSKMMGSLVDQVKKEVDDTKSQHRYADYVNGVRGHLTKVQNLQQELLQKLAELEKEEKAKITSESIHDGFNASHVSKAKPATSSATSASSTKPKPSATTTELLNPDATTSLAGDQSSSLQNTDLAVSSGAETDIEDGDDQDTASIKLTGEGQEFSRIGLHDYRGLLAFISQHPDIVSEATHDALLVEAFNAQMSGKETRARTCVHHGLLLQYCRQLGPDGVGLFFKRITTKGHNAQQVFDKDVAETYQRIKTRAAELKKEEDERDAQGGVEQIQLHAVDPGTEIRINVPQPNSSEQVEKQARKIFESFPPGLQRALESGSLDQVNVVLGKMSVEEAEDVVEKLGQGGMLSLHEGVIDATNEEGQQLLKQLEDEERLRKHKQQEEQDEEQGDMGEPGAKVDTVLEEQGRTRSAPEHNIVDDID